MRSLFWTFFFQGHQPEQDKQIQKEENVMEDLKTSNEKEYEENPNMVGKRGGETDDELTFVLSLSLSLNTINRSFCVVKTNLN